MKRVITLLLALCMMFALAACGAKAKCDVCGETKNCETIEVLGEKIHICGDCKDSINDLVDMFGG